MADGAEAGTRTRSYSYSTAGLDMGAAMRMTGLAYMRALAAGEFGARPSIGDTIGMTVPFDIDFGKVSFAAEAADFLLNPLGAVHGGFAATLLDSCMGCAVHTTLPEATGYTTAELKVNYTRAILPRTGRLVATGSVIHAGRRMATAEGRLTGEDGKLYAHGSTTCFVFPLTEAR